MNIEQIKLTQINDQFDSAYQTIWNQIIIPNQRFINDESDPKERAILQKKHDLLCNRLNIMHDMFEHVLRMCVDQPTSDQYKFQQELIRQLREYIRKLGGNPAIASYIKQSDF